jgi:hypothetical protein
MISEEVDILWSECVGSRKLTPKDELKQLRRLADEKRLSWSALMCLFYSSKIWNGMRWKVLQRDKVCVICGSEMHLNVDHINYPKKIGGETLKDLQVLCWLCHRAKSKRFDLGANGFDDILKVSVEEGGPLYAAKGVR